MIILCEECGKKYRVDPSKVSEGMKFKCKACNHVITVSKPEVRTPEPEAFIEPEEEVGTVKTETPSAEPDEKSEKRVRPTSDILTAGQKGRLGLRFKMMLLFFALPIIIVAGAGILYLWQMSSLSLLLTEQSAETVKIMAQDLVKEKARAASKQISQYIATHPELNKEDFNYEMRFRLIAVQKVGLTGYTSLYSIPDEQGLSTFWMHPNAKLVGINTTESMQKILGNDFNDFNKIYQGAYKGAEAEGYYFGKDADGKKQEIYMVSSPVEGTPFVVAATVFLDEFTRPIRVMETRSQKLISDTPPAKRVASGSPPEGGVFFGKAPLEL